MTDKKPAWTGKLGAEDKTTFAPTTRKNFFVLSETPQQLAPVIVKGKIRRSDTGHQILVPLPAAVEARLAAAIMGAQGPGIVGLIEYALDTLEKKNKSLLIENEPER